MSLLVDYRYHGSRVLDYVKTACIVVVAGTCIWVGSAVVHTLNGFHKFMDGAASDIHTAVVSLDSTLSGVRETMQTTNQAVAETRELLAKQKGYSDAQNKRVLDVLEQTETALINAQRVMEDINDSQKQATAATVDAVQTLKPVLQNAAKAAEQASLTISDPAIHKSLDNVSKATENVANATATLNTTVGRIDKKVEQALKPAPLAERIIFTVGGKLFGLVANIRNAIGK